MTNKKLKKVVNYSKKHMAESVDPVHDFGHVERVAKNTLRIADALNLSDLDTNLLQALGYLHDLHYADHDPTIHHRLFENIHAMQKTRETLKDLRIKNEEEKKRHRQVYDNVINGVFKKIFAWRSCGVFKS